MTPIYLDNHATTPLDPEVLEAMLPYFTENYGNAASKHAQGWTADKAVEKARAEVAALIGAQPREITFTSGATESNNLGLFGIAESYRDRGNHIVTSQIEHKSILDSCTELERRGFSVTYVPVDKYGTVNPEDVLKAVTDKTILVSIQLANNEVGTIQDIHAIGKLLRAREIFFHTDAVQGASTLKIDVTELGVDLLSLSAHKMYGPKGVGALYVRHKSPRIKLKPLIFGGGQERGLRSGTLNVPSIVGFGKACALVEKKRAEEYEKTKSLRDQLELELIGNFAVKINGHTNSSQKLPGNLNFTLSHEDVNEVMKAAPELSLSTGAACSAAEIEPSHVLTALGLSTDAALRTLRIGLGRFNSTGDIQNALNAFKRALSPGQNDAATL